MGGRGRDARGRRAAMPSTRRSAKSGREPWAAIVGSPLYLRGVSTLTAFGLATEIGDWRRFDGRSLGAYLGLVPSESSSGERRRQGAITKTGNAHARRLLVEAAWHQRRPSSQPSRELARRREGQPAAVRRARGGGRPPPAAASATSMLAASAPRWPPWPSLVGSRAGAGASPSWTTETPEWEVTASAPGPTTRGACATGL